MKNISKLCLEYNIVDFALNSDNSIDVFGDVRIQHIKLQQIPIKFNKVSGNFFCNSNVLTSLEGCPKYVGGDFDCSRNSLTTLEYCPIEVSGSFNCTNNRLTTLEHCPHIVGDGFYCFSNELTSLEYLPKKINILNCQHNRISTLAHIGTIVKGAFFEANRELFEFNELTSMLSMEYILIFLTYQNYYDVWEPELNVANTQILIDDIKDGLR